MKRHLASLLAVLLFATTFSACVVGDKDNDTNPNYSGSTAPALVDDSTIDGQLTEFSLAALDAANFGSIFAYPGGGMAGSLRSALTRFPSGLITLEDFNYDDDGIGTAVLYSSEGTTRIVFSDWARPTGGYITGTMDLVGPTDFDEYSLYRFSNVSVVVENYFPVPLEVTGSMDMKVYDQVEENIRIGSFGDRVVTTTDLAVKASEDLRSSTRGTVREPASYSTQFWVKAEYTVEPYNGGYAGGGYYGGGGVELDEASGTIDEGLQLSVAGRVYTELDGFIEVSTDADVPLLYQPGHDETTGHSDNRYNLPLEGKLYLTDINGNRIAAEIYFDSWVDADSSDGYLWDRGVDYWFDVDKDGVQDIDTEYYDSFTYGNTY